jgi:hypothetical protein
MRRIRDHLTYANVMATIAVFLVLSGGTAVALDGINTVDSGDIINDQVKSVDVRNDDLPTGGLGAVDLRPNSVRGSEVQDGSLAPADSSNVVARVRGTDSVSTGDGGFASPASYPLPNNTWTQAATEVEGFVGEATIDDEAPSESCNAVVIIRVDGQLVGTMFFSTETRHVLVPVTSDPYLFEPGVPTERTMTAEVWDNCTNPGNDFTVTSVKVDAIGDR